jgi:hypothetical protein
MEQVRIAEICGCARYVTMSFDDFLSVENSHGFHEDLQKA